MTQFEVAELRASHASEKLATAQQALKTAEEATAAAQRDREFAVQERLEAQASVEQLRTSLAELTSRVESAKPELVKSRLVYIQFSGDITRNRIDGLRSALRAKGCQAPGAERIAGNYRPMVKYFSSADAADAQQLAKDTQEFFESAGCPITLSVIEALFVPEPFDGSTIPFGHRLRANGLPNQPFQSTTAFQPVPSSVP